MTSFKVSTVRARQPVSLVLALVFTALTIMALPVLAQQRPDDTVWIQIEAHPSLTVAQQRAREYADSIENVNGFALGGNWYGIVLGPYLRADAREVLRSHRRAGQVPRDSFIVEARSFGGQFFPEGADGLNRDASTTPAVSTIAAAPVPVPQPADETPAEAKRSERALSAEQRRELQVALKSAGFYAAAIDGAFGAGTRRSMSAWQGANGFTETGVLTTAQRRLLLDQYNAPLISVGMAPLSDAAAGIQMQMPLGEVAFSRLEPPFAHYDSTTGGGIRVLLISQPGNQATLYGLYDIMQTLAIVPLDGPRERRARSFTLEGRDARMVSYTEAVLEDGEIKGFTLIWPTGDEARRTRVLALMRQSFARLPGVLDPAAGADTAQNIDLVAGLEVRRPRLSRSGFYVDARGAVVTTTEAVRACTRITLDDLYRAEVLSADDATGIAVLRPSEPLAPARVAAFRQSDPRLKSQVVVAGYSFEGALGAPSLTYGNLEDLRGLTGEAGLNRLALAALPGDAGGPVLDQSGAVVGMLLPEAGTSRKLPEGVSFAAAVAAIGTVLDGAGVRALASATGDRATPDDLIATASGMTVLVSCWD